MFDIWEKWGEGCLGRRKELLLLDDLCECAVPLVAPRLLQLSLLLHLDESLLADLGEVILLRVCRKEEEKWGRELGRELGREVGREVEREAHTRTRATGFNAQECG